MTPHAAKRGIPSGAILFAHMIFIEKYKITPDALKIKLGSSKRWESPFVTYGLSTLSCHVQTADNLLNSVTEVLINF